MAQLTVNLPPELPVEEARLLLMIKLYETERLSLGQAAELAGYSKPAFVELLGKHGVSVFNYSTEDVKRELQL